MRLRDLPPLAATTTLFVGTLVITHYVRDYETRLTNAHFVRRSAVVQGAVQREIDGNVEAVRSLAGLFDASEAVTRDEFRSFTYRPLLSHPSLRAIAWIPRVAAPDLAAHISSAHEHGVGRYRVVERAADGSWADAAERPVYFPVFYLEPPAGNQAALGFDMGSDARRLEALHRARDIGEPVSTAPVRLVPADSLVGFLVVLPIFNKDLPSTTSAERRLALEGFAIGTFEIEALVEEATRALGPTGVSFELTDAEDADSYADAPLAIYGRPAPLSTYDGWLTPRQDPWLATVDLPGRSWQLRFHPDSSFVEEHTARLSAAVLAGGTLMSALLGAYLFGSATRTRRVEGLARELRAANQLLSREVAERARAEARTRELNEELENRVVERTSALSETNARLTAQVEQTARAEAELRDSQTRLAALLVGFPGAVWTCDEDRLLRTTAGARLESLFRSETPPSGAALASALRSDAPVEHLLRAHIQALSGTPSALGAEVGDRCFEIRVDPIDLADGPGVIAVALDVTESRRLEAEQLRARLQDMQRLESLGLLAGGVAHDYNNLLVGILGNATLASDQVPADSPLRELLTDISDSAERAAELTRQLLAYSGKGALFIDTLDLSSLVRRMDRLLATTVGDRATIELDLGEGLPPVEADAGQMQQVIMNLVSNAVDAMPQRTPADRNRRLWVRTRLEELDETRLREFVLSEERPAGPYLVIEVEDQGVGMDAETLRRVFDPFFTTKELGQGLGLAATFGIVRGHEGTIEVESQRGCGTRVRVFLPPAEGAATERPQHSLAERAERAERARGHVVLIIDDEPSVRDFASSAMQYLGLEPRAVSSGEEGLAWMADHPGEATIVLLDISMPEMDGHRVLEEIRSLDPEIPVILSSGYSEEEVINGTPAAQWCRFLAKPYRLSELGAAVLAEIEPDPDRA